MGEVGVWGMGWGWNVVVVGMWCGGGEGEVGVWGMPFSGTLEIPKCQKHV